MCVVLLKKKLKYFFVAQEEKDSNKLFLQKDFAQINLFV